VWPVTDHQFNRAFRLAGNWGAMSRSGQFSTWSPLSSFGSLV
jgi:hypothetical protein